MAKHLTLISQYAFYPMHWEAFRYLCKHYDVRASVITPPLPEMPPLHQRLVTMGAEEARREPFHPDVREMPAALTKVDHRQWLSKQLDSLRPDAIWVQEEPTSRLLLDVLRHYKADRGPVIICALAENIFRLRWWRRLQFARVWRRLDRLIAVASASIEGIRRAGMPACVPADTLVAGAQAPPEPLAAMTLPFPRSSDDFVVGFAGRICPEKGWHLLTDAIQMLPGNFKLAIAGDGPQADLLRERLQAPNLAARAAYFGPLAKSDLWSFYKSVDCVAAPHRTFPHWKEQFGGVLADAMALGLPIVGSDSGAIPEVVGPAGLIVPENDASALANAIQSLHHEPHLRQRLSKLGKARFHTRFAIPVYARNIASALLLDPRSSRHVAAA